MSRVAIECLAKDNLLVVSGEMNTKARINPEQIAKRVWQEIGYGDPAELVVIITSKNNLLISPVATKAPGLILVVLATRVSW